MTNFNFQRLNIKKKWRIRSKINSEEVQGIIKKFPDNKAHLSCRYGEEFEITLSKSPSFFKYKLHHFMDHTLYCIKLILHSN